MNSLLISLILVIIFGYLFLHFEAQKKKEIKSIQKQYENKLVNIKNEHNNNHIPIHQNNNINKISHEINQRNLINNLEIQQLQHKSSLQSNNPTLEDAIITRDYRVVYDPLVPAVKRPDINAFPHLEFSKYIDIPTRGYPDTYQYIGNMFKITGNTDVSGEKVVKLFGRQKYPSSNQYEYYGMTNDSTTLNYKIPITTKRNMELNDGDNIEISQLGGLYQVNIHPDQTFRYNPNLF
jgi:hypothetical protein